MHCVWSCLNIWSCLVISELAVLQAGPSRVGFRQQRQQIVAKPASPRAYTQQSMSGLRQLGSCRKVVPRLNVIISWPDRAVHELMASATSTFNMQEERRGERADDLPVSVVN